MKKGQEVYIIEEYHRRKVGQRTYSVESAIFKENIEHGRVLVQFGGHFKNMHPHDVYVNELDAKRDKADYELRDRVDFLASRERVLTEKTDHFESLLKGEWHWISRNILVSLVVTLSTLCVLQFVIL